MTDKQKLIAGLAATLEVTPEDIMIYQATSSTYAPGYTVILTDYRKYTAVVPNYEIEKPDESALVNVGGVDLPAEYVLYYNNPQDHSRADLRDLAAYLEIPKARTLNKNALVKEIKAYKGRGNPPVVAPEPAGRYKAYYDDGVQVVAPKPAQDEPLTIAEASKELFD